MGGAGAVAGVERRGCGGARGRGAGGPRQHLGGCARELGAHALEGVGAHPAARMHTQAALRPELCRELLRHAVRRTPVLAHVLCPAHRTQRVPRVWSLTLFISCCLDKSILKR